MMNFFANADGSVTICIRRSPPHHTSTVQRPDTCGPGAPRPHQPSGRSGHAGAPGKGPPSLAASDEPATVQAHPRNPSPATRGGNGRLKDFAHQNPTGPNHRHPWDAAAPRTHSRPPLLAANNYACTADG